MNRNMKAIIWAMDSKGLSAGAWKLLVILARRVNEDGFDVWPSHATLSEQCEFSVSSVRRYIEELVAQGFVVVVPRYDDRGDRTSNIYRLQVDVEVSFANGRKTSAKPDDVGGDGPKPPVQFEQTPPVQIEQTPLLTCEQTPLLTCEQGMIQDLNDSRMNLDSGDLKSPGGVEEEFRLAIMDDKPARESLTCYVERRFNEIASLNDGIARCRKIDDALGDSIRSRAREHARPGQDPREVWDEALSAVLSSRFLCGKVPPRPGSEKSFRLTLGWMTKRSNFREIIGGKYSGQDKPGTVDPATGRRLGPTAQAVSGTVARLRAAREREQQRGNPAGDHPGLAG